MHCGRCGAEHGPEAEFCKNCGAPLGGTEPEPPQYPESQQYPGSPQYPESPQYPGSPPYASYPPPSFGPPSQFAPPPPQVPPGYYPEPYPVAKKRSRLRIGLIAAACVVALAGAGLGAYFGLRGDDGDSKTAGSQEKPKSTSTTEAPEGTTTEAPEGTTSSSRPPTTVAADAQRGGTLRFRLGEVESIDPAYVFLADEFLVVNSLFDSLTTYDPTTQELLPAAAESWEANADCSVWTFHLVPDATFHNGDPVTAADFKYAWERLCDPATGSTAFYHLGAVDGYEEMLAGTATELSGVQAVDDGTLRVTLSYPFAEFGYIVSHVALAPVPRNAVQGDLAGFEDMPIGNGPFMASGPWTPGDLVKVERYAGYYGAPAYLDGVDFHIVADEDTAYAQFQAGALDFTSIPFGKVEAASSTYGLSADGYTAAPGSQVLTGTELSVYYLALNNATGPLTNTALRQALSLAIDRQQIIDDLYEGRWQPATGIVPEGLPGYQEDSWEYCRYDPEAAADKLEEAGYPGGQGLPEIVLSCPTSHESVMTAVRDYFAAIGVDASVETVESFDFFGALMDGEFEVARTGWIADYPILDSMLYPLFFTGSGDNYSLFSDSVVDRHLLEARSTADRAARLAEYQAADQAIGEACPVIPLYYYSHHHVASDRVHGLFYSALGDANLDTVWIEER